MQCIRTLTRLAFLAVFTRCSFLHNSKTQTGFDFVGRKISLYRSGLHTNITIHLITSRNCPVLFFILAFSPQYFIANLVNTLWPNYFYVSKTYRGVLSGSTGSCLSSLYKNHFLLKLVCVNNCVYILTNGLGLYSWLRM